MRISPQLQAYRYVLRLEMSVLRFLEQHRRGLFRLKNVLLILIQGTVGGCMGVNEVGFSLTGGD